MDNFINILIVDDHPMIIDAYVSILSAAFIKSDFIFEKAINCEEAYNIIERTFKNKGKIDVIILDISLPAFKKMKLESGEDLGCYIKIKFPNSKIIIITHNKDGYLLNKTFNALKPAGFINKADIDANNFPNTFMNILNGNTHVSETIKNAMDEFNDDKIRLDEIDFEILSLLEKGIKTKELPNYIKLSLSAIEKRKAKIKFYLTVNKRDNNQMLRNK